MRKLFLLVLAISLFAACNKDKTNPQEESNYFPMQIGNYWVYQHYNIDSLGNETDMNKTDSVIIKRDTIINNKQYFVLEGTNYPYNGNRWEILDYLRDSSGYLVNINGVIKCSNNNFSDTLLSKTEIIGEDTLFVLTYQMEESLNPIIVPAGEFEAINFKGTVVMPKDQPGIQNTRFMNNYYADGIGKIIDTYFFLSSSFINEKRLVRYNIEN